jgi:NAD(P)-dependent dehydrogenase (short-subunit alcohol dehydrogenase family)
VLARELLLKERKSPFALETLRSCARAKEDLIRRGATSVLAFVCDLSDKEQVADMVRSALERFGHLDILVNNAGIIQVGPVNEMRLEDYRKNNQLG